MSLKKARRSDLNKIYDICTQFEGITQIYPADILRTTLIKYIDEGTVIYDRGIIIVYSYFGTTQKLPFDYETFPEDVLISIVVNENPGNGLADIVMDEFLASVSSDVYSASLNDNKWITQRLIRRGYKKLWDGKVKVSGKFRNISIWKETERVN